MATPADLRSAAEAYATQAAITAAAVTAARAVRPQSAERIAQLVAAYQLLAAQQATAAVPAMLAEQGASTATAASVVTSTLAGFTSSGYPLATMFESINSAAHLGMLVASAVQDAGRNGAALQMAVTPSVTGYVRMLNPPSCSRCAILAGVEYDLSEPFERHPSCDCRHVPISENVSGDLTTDPRAYFDSLPSTEDLNERYPLLDRGLRREAGIYSREDIFGVAGSQAILDGADMNQVVNARRGMAPAQVFGRDALHTFEGVTRRSLFRKSQPASKRPVRLMPESIYRIAGVDREQALRLLKVYGYIL